VDILPGMDATYLVILIATFVGMSALSLYVVAKLSAGPR
jgi:hypothetical protein